MNLADSVETILDAILDVLEQETNIGDLGEIQAVVRGDRARPMPALPAVWVVPQAAQMARLTFNDEDWSLPVSISALVKGDDPAEAGKASQRLTALARSAVLRSARDAANAADAMVTDIVSVSFDPTARSSERNRTLFWTEAVVMVTFTVIEE